MLFCVNWPRVAALSRLGCLWPADSNACEAARPADEVPVDRARHHRYRAGSPIGRELARDVRAKVVDRRQEGLDRAMTGMPLSEKLRRGVKVSRLEGSGARSHDHSVGQHPAVRQPTMSTAELRRRRESNHDRMDG